MSDIDYSALSDWSLLSRYRDGDEEACTVLLARYANLINRRILYVTVNGIDKDDIRQEAYMGLFNAIRTFSPDKNASFCGYASLCVGNSLKNLFAASSTKKARAYRQTVSIDDIEAVDMRGNDSMNPEALLLNQEACGELKKLMESVLSGFERDVLFYYLSGRGYNEVAERLRTSPKSVDNALQRARRKLKAVLNNL